MKNKVSPKPASKKVPAKQAKPKLKIAKPSGLAGGFVRLSETHIRKVYR